MTQRRRKDDLLDTDERKAIEDAVDNAVEKGISMDEKIRIHKEECGKPLAADMRIVQEFRIEMNVHMRQLKWLLMAAIISVLANNGLGRIIASILPIQKSHATEITIKDGGV
jgi:hypothetical protein